MLKKFKEDYPLIIIASSISIVIIILFTVFYGCLSAYPIVSVCFQLAIGILINSIFFYTQIYLAQKKQSQIADKCIVKRIERIQREMQEIFNKLGELYIDEYGRGTVLDEQQLKTMLQKTKIGDHVHVIDPRKHGLEENPHFTVKEFIINKVQYVEREIDRLCSYYNQYITPELMDTLDKILDSALHNSFARSLIQVADGVTFDQCRDDSFYKPYYGLILELDLRKKQYQ